MEKINVKLESFEGPLSLLCHLIDRNKIDIYDIPIVEITNQYMEILYRSKIKNMDNISEFLVMATSLLEIKSKMLLPKPKSDEEEDELDPREELIRKLLEYKKFKEITEEFRQREEYASLLLFKESNTASLYIVEEDIEQIDNVLDGISFNDILNAYEDVLKRQELKVDKVRSGFKKVERDLFTIDEKIEYIKDLLIVYPKVKFQEIFRESVGKSEIVVTFLALLELIKMKNIFIKQDNLFDDIIITRPDVNI